MARFCKVRAKAGYPPPSTEVFVFALRRLAEGNHFTGPNMSVQNGLTMHPSWVYPTGREKLDKKPSNPSFLSRS
jgi:hypothetical protein